MLVLTRRPSEQIFVGDDIVITITEIRGDNVRVAIDAPKAVKIYRGEIYQAIMRENQEAAKQNGKLDILKDFEANISDKKIQKEALFKERE